MQSYCCCFALDPRPEPEGGERQYRRSVWYSLKQGPFTHKGTLQTEHIFEVSFLFLFLEHTRQRFCAPGLSLTGTG